MGQEVWYVMVPLIRRVYIEFIVILTGDVITATAPGNTMIILNSFVAARELLDKQGASFSGRPYVPVFELYVHHKSRSG